MAEQDYKKNLFTPKNIFIYAVVALLLYGAVYFLFLSNKSGSPYQTPANEVAEEEMEDEGAMTVPLLPQNDSGQSGTATLTEEDGMVKVEIELAAPSDVPQPAHIHMGACPTPGEVAYPLTNVVNGESETVLEVSLADLKAQMPLAVNVHKSAAEISVYTSCGDLK